MTKYVGGMLAGALLVGVGMVALWPMAVALGGFLTGACHMLGTVAYVESLPETV